MDNYIWTTETLNFLNNVFILQQFILIEIGKIMGYTDKWVLLYSIYPTTYLVTSIFKLLQAWLGTVLTLKQVRVIAAVLTQYILTSLLISTN